MQQNLLITLYGQANRQKLGADWKLRCLPLERCLPLASTLRLCVFRDGEDKRGKIIDFASADRRVWDGVEGGFPDAPYGGLCHGENSPNYSKVVRLVESVFAATIAPLVEVEFDRLAIAASQIVDSRARADAYQDAQWELLSMFGDFGFTEAGARKLERLAEAKGMLFDQLIDEAHGVSPTTKRKSRKRIK
jgi:hypothetical protein